MCDRVDTIGSEIRIYIESYGKNNFAEISKNLTRYRSENNFVEPSK